MSDSKKKTGAVKKTAEPGKVEEPIGSKTVAAEAEQAKPAVDEPEKDKPTADQIAGAMEELREHVVTVAEGKSITSLKGILAPGDVVTPDSFAGGLKTFSDLGGKGYFAIDGEQPK